ncbi:hypothetical protein CROQUDRAFT_87597 [Cronartium quercuum f. sp. fusiforme G11]|uniref:WD40 repeat-like protein n=1 Tax=Cronartium quercuum f. sp. fusiforme G11 TaxID=708437 RepID=A0A9P6NSE2_9BASI|nr:hypothetical protein CROQUDRAFT_87597 [Cronartium quercuum f. sp. fusiforme G11]
MEFPNSPTPGPSSRPQFFTEPDTDENDPSNSYPTPPISEADPLFSVPSYYPNRNRTRTISTRSARYRQPTLSECLNRHASSPTSDAFSIYPVTSSVIEEDDDQDEISCAPSTRSKRARLSSIASSDFLRLSSDPPIDSDWIRSEPIHRTKSLNRGRKSRISNPTHDLLSMDHLLCPSRIGEFRCMKALRSCPETQTIRLWNEVYEKGYEFPFSLTFNHAAKTRGGRRDGQLLAVASAMGTISLYDPYTKASVEDFQPLQTLQAVQNGIFALSFSSSDRILATGSGEQISELFDIETGNMVGRLEDHQGTVKTVEFSDVDENLVVTASRDGSIKIWDLRLVGSGGGGQDVFEIPVYQPILTIRNAHDEKHAGRKRKKGAHLPSVSSVLWSKHLDRHLFSAGSVNGIVKLWDIRKKTPYSSKIHPVPAEQSADQNVHELSSVRPHGISSLTLSSDGARLYSLGTDSIIRTHDTLYLSRDPSSQLPHFTHPSLIATSLYIKLSISNCDKLLACGSSRGEIFLWDVSSDSSSEYAVLEDAHQKEICGLEFWDQGLASCGDDGAIRLWSWDR